MMNSLAGPKQYYSLTHATGLLYQFSLRLSLVTSPSIKDLSHSSLGSLTSKALTARPLIYHLNANIRRNSFIKPL